MQLHCPLRAFKPNVYKGICISIYLSIYLSILFICLYACISVYLYSSTVITKLYLNHDMLSIIFK